jgi:hypothetical protein
MAIWCRYFVVIWYIFHRFGILYQEKSGNPAFKPSVEQNWLKPFLSFGFGSLRKEKAVLRQGDQNGLIFAYWAIVYFGKFFL